MLKPTMPEATARATPQARKHALLAASAARRRALADDWQTLAPTAQRLDAGLRTAQRLVRSPVAIAGASLALTLLLRRPARTGGRLLRFGLLGWRLARLALSVYRSQR